MSVDVEVVTGWVAARWVAAPGALLLAGSGVFGACWAALRRRARREREVLRLDPFNLEPGRVELAGTAEALDGQRELAPAFLLKLESGVRVRVECERPVMKEGEQVLVRGVLHGSISAQPNAERAKVEDARLSTEAFSGALESRAAHLGDLAIVLLVAAFATQLFYVGFYLEALLHALGRDVPPTIVVAIYFWVALVSGSVLLGATLNALEHLRR